MHTTDTVDMEIVLSGDVNLELDAGVEKTLHLGDVNIQDGRGTAGTIAGPHRW
jgi:hypothetical protein